METAKENCLDQRLHADFEQGAQGQLLGRICLPALTTNVRIARQFVRFRLQAEQLSAIVCETAELIGSELVTNAVVHHECNSQSAVLLGISRAERFLYIDVYDTNPAMPRPRRPDAVTASGRGLQVVEALSDRWGTNRTADGKVVWARLIAWPDETTGRAG